MTITLFEDDEWKKFLPIAWTRGVWDIITGGFTQKKRARLFYDSDIFTYSKRDYIKNNYPEDPPFVYVNARLMNFIPLSELKEDTIVRSRNTIAYIYSNKVIDPLTPPEFPIKDMDIPFFNAIYEVIEEFPERLKRDLESLIKNTKIKEIEGVYIIGEHKAIIGNNVEISPPITIDTDEGPVIIGAGTKIEPFTFIKGPVLIGNNCFIKSGTRLTDGIFLGDWTKIGGEIEHTIIQGYSNKQHQGFLGHSYIGEWVNLGAGTTNSDLKNNYSNVSIITPDGKIKTGMRFLGLIAGDHTKSAINTSFNTGTLVGPFVNIVSSGFPPKYIPPFTWYVEKGEEYNLEKALETAAIVMKRRNVVMDDVYKSMVKRVFELTKQTR